VIQGYRAENEAVRKRVALIYRERRELREKTDLAQKNEEEAQHE
jgi:hypothetical protein